MFFEEEGLLGKAKSFMPQMQSVPMHWGNFALIFAVGAILIVVSIPFASFLLLNPKPFCMLFSLGSAIILIAMFQIVEWKSLYSKFTRSVGFICYLSSLVVSLYAGVVHIGYIYTLVVLSIQICSLIYLTISLFPGGRAGLHIGFRALKDKVKQFFISPTLLPL